MIPEPVTLTNLILASIALFTGPITGGYLAISERKKNRGEDSLYILGTTPGTLISTLYMAYEPNYIPLIFAGFTISLPWKTFLTQTLPTLLPPNRILIEPVKSIGHAMKYALLHW